MEIRVTEIVRAAQPLLAHLPANAWVPWALSKRPNGKWDKKPTRGATTSDATQWRTFDTALAEWTSTDVQYGQPPIAGIGFIIAAGMITFDIDHCRDPNTGILEDDATAELERCNSYAYVTPSGTGIRIVGTNAIEHPIRGQKKNLKLPSGRTIEVFVGPTNHFNTFTPQVIDGYETVRDISDCALDLMAGLPEFVATEDTSTPAPPLVTDAEALTDLKDVADALAKLPNNDLDWDAWNVVGMTVWRVTGGSADGFTLFDEWSAKSPKYMGSETLARWQHYRISPPRRVTFGKLVWLVRNMPGGDPTFREPVVPEMFKPAPEYEQADGETPGQTSFKKSPPPANLPLIYFSDIKSNLDTADFVEGLLIEGGMSVVYGETNCGKTFFMTDLGLHISMGGQWWGREVEFGGVVYCALEGAHGISNRVAAFRQHHGLEGTGLPFAIIPVSINLLDPKVDVERLVQAIRCAADEMGCPVRLVVIDTLSRAMAGGNENAPDDMGALVASGDKIRQATGAHIAFVHHSGKDSAKGARGHSILRAATDTEIEIAREGDTGPSVATVRKQRELPIEGEFKFSLKTIVLGHNRRGKKVTSCVIEDVRDIRDIRDIAGHVPMSRKVKLNLGAQIALKMFDRAVAKYGRPPPQAIDYPQNVVVCSAKVWRSEFYWGGMPDADVETKRKAFNRGRDELLKNSVLSSFNDFVWRVKDAV